MRGYAPGMLDIARALILLVAMVRAIQGRFVAGIVFGALAALLMGAAGVFAHEALARQDVNGEYAFHLSYMGPTMLPLGGHLWLPTAMQLGLAALTLVPTLHVLRAPAGPYTNVFLLVFIPNAMLAVMASLSAFLTWRQRSEFPEYWASPSLARDAPPPASYERLLLLPAREEGSLVSHARYDRGRRSGWASTAATLVALLVRNHSSERIHLVGLQATGRRDARPESLDRDVADPGGVLEETVGSGSAFVIADDAGSAMCTFVVGARDAVVEVEGSCR